MAYLPYWDGKTVAFFCDECGWAGMRGRGLKLCPQCHARLPKRTKSRDEKAKTIIQKKVKLYGQGKVH